MNEQEFSAIIVDVIRSRKPNGEFYLTHQSCISAIATMKSFEPKKCECGSFKVDDTDVRCAKCGGTLKNITNSPLDSLERAIEKASTTVEYEKDKEYYAAIALAVRNYVKNGGKI